MCDEVELTNSTSGSMVLLQGRYALIPYTHRPVVGGSVEFVLNVQVGYPPVSAAADISPISPFLNSWLSTDISHTSN